MKIYLLWIILFPIGVFAQFNTIRNLETPAKQKMDTVWKEIDTALIVDKDLDSIAWRMVYEQFVKDKSETQTKDTSFHLYWPLRSVQVTSPFGNRFHPIEKVWKMHNGVDLKAFYEPVYAIADGIVKTAAYGQKEGNYIVLLHGEIESIYCHLSKLDCIQGQLMKGGDCIGMSGNSGSSTGPHLHFGIKKDNVYRNPI